MANKTKSSRSSTRNGLEWNRVTWYSRLWALLVFLLIIPVLAFYIGTQYQRTIEVLTIASWSSTGMGAPHMMMRGPMPQSGY